MKTEQIPVSASLILGPPQSGKTRMLAQQVVATSEQAYDRTLFLCATEAEKVAASALLAQTSCRVATWQEIALEIMDEPAARSRFNRMPRLLEPYEEKILNEDLKVAEIKKRHRMRKILYYLYYGWASLRECDGQSLETSYTWEELDIIDQLHESLEFTGGILSCELSNFALKTLQDNADVATRHSYDAIFVDDYEQLNRATQQLACFIAKKSIAIAAGNLPTQVEREAYPCFEGVQEFLDAFPSAEVTALSSTYQLPEASRAVAGFASDPAAFSPLAKDYSFCTTAPTSTSESPAIRIEANMGEELRAIAQECAAALSKNQTVAIVGTNRSWRKNTESQLSRAGLPVGFAKGDVALGGDLREERSYARAKKDALAKLLINPEDAVAWRSMLAFGDYMANSASIDVLRKAVKGSGLRIHEALSKIVSGEAIEGFDTSSPLIANLVETYRSRVGDVRIAAERPAQQHQPDESASQQTESSILVCSPAQLFDLRPDLVIFGGCVTGFIPCRDYNDPASLVGEARERERTRCLRTLYAAAAHAKKRIVFTAFTSCSLENAEILKLHIVKSGLKQGIRLATIEPCEFLQLVSESK